MKGPGGKVGIFFVTALICAAVAFALGWRSIAGIVMTATGAGIAVVLGTRDRRGKDQ